MSDRREASSDDLLQELEQMRGSPGTPAVDHERLLRWARAARAEAPPPLATGPVEPPGSSDIDHPPEAGSAAEEQARARGRDSLRAGELAFVVLAGGMATRMGGVVKALVDALPGRSFLNLRLEQQEAGAARGFQVPLWLMTSHATDEAIRRELGPRLRGDELATFTQDASLRLTPEGGLFRDAEGHAQPYATGHGDLPDALRRSGLLDRFLERGGRTLLIANLDNLAASVDEVLLGWHLGHGGPLTVELVAKQPGDRGGGPVRTGGRTVLLEDVRLPAGFDSASVPYFSTNTFWADAAALAGLSFDWTYARVEKRVDDRVAIQFERILNELTSALPARYLLVPRSGARGRFLPVKDQQELASRRPEIEQLMRGLGA
ncbi:MAG: UTP--glucose-phosphate uridylyltransferase [Gaiellales bacterium]|nr:UTP--glucose-phosphate uridylyltransferase [Gaiellales bacterium]